MKEKNLFGVTAFFLSILNTISFFIAVYVHSNLFLFPYKDPSNPNSPASNIISGQNILVHMMFTSLGIIIAILNFSVSLLSSRKNRQSNQLIKLFGWGFIIISVGFMIYFSNRFIQLWNLNMSLGGNCMANIYCGE